jgi:hypothetical protein
MLMLMLMIMLMICSCGGECTQYQEQEGEQAEGRCAGASGSFVGMIPPLPAQLFTH